MSFLKGNLGDRIGALRNFRHFPNGIAWDPRGKYIAIMSTNGHFDIIDAFKFTRLRNCSRIELPKAILNKDFMIPQKVFFKLYFIYFRIIKSFTTINCIPLLEEWNFLHVARLFLLQVN